jgi:hypothetical protein
MERVILFLSGSALRFSQPLSGFLAHPSLRPCFVPKPFLGFSPFRGFPSQESRTPLGATCSPVVIHQRAGTHPRRSYPPVSPTPASARRSCLVPPAASSHLSAHPKTRFPVAHWITSGGTAPFRQLHRLRSLTPPANPFTPSQVALKRRPILSWSSAPLELSPPTPRILRPARAHWARARA